MARPKKYITEEDKIKAIKNYQKQYRLANKEKSREYFKNYRVEKKEHLKQLSSKYRNKNISKLKDKRKIWLSNNPDYIKNYKKKWNSENKESHKEYYSTNKIKIKIRTKEYAVKNKEKSNHYKNKWNKKNRMYFLQYYNKNHDKITLMKKKHRQTEKYKISQRLCTQKRTHRKFMVMEKILSKQDAQNIFLKFNNSCYNCNSKEYLCLDHHYPLSKGFALTINNAVLLCRTCNCKKGIKLPEIFYSPEQLIDLQDNYGITKQPQKIEEQLSLFEARMPKNLERDNGLFEAMNAA